MTYFKNRAKFT